MHRLRYVVLHHSKQAPRRCTVRTLAFWNSQPQKQQRSKEGINENVISVVVGSQRFLKNRTTANDLLDAQKQGKTLTRSEVALIRQSREDTKVCQLLHGECMH